MCDYYDQANNCRYFNFIKIPAWLSVIFLAEFAETMDTKLGPELHFFLMEVQFHKK